MAELGAKSCSSPGCRIHDFLPYTCPACNDIFCSEHYSISAHFCEKGQAYLASRGDEGGAIPAAGPHGSHPLSSSKPSEVMAAVTSRFDGREGELNVGVSHYNIKASASEGDSKSCRPVAADRRLTDAQMAVDKASSEKGKRVSSQVLKMLVKSKAVGDRRLRMEDRFFLEVHYWGNNQDVHYLYFSRLWTVGRVLDEILRTRRRFLQLEPGIRDAPLDLANSDSPGGLPAGGVLNDLAPRLRSFDAVTVRPRISIDPAVAGNDSAAVVSGSGSKLEVKVGCIDQSAAGLGVEVEVQSGRLLPQGKGGSGGDAEKSEGLLTGEDGCGDRRGAQSRGLDSSSVAAWRSSVEGGLTIMIGHGRNVHRLSGIRPDETRVLDLKRQLEPLTGVPPVRQKLVFKGILRDADLIGNTKIVDGAKLMLLGAPESGRAARK